MVPTIVNVVLKDLNALYDINNTLTYTHESLLGITKQCLPHLDTTLREKLSSQSMLPGHEITTLVDSAAQGRRCCKQCKSKQKPSKPDPFTGTSESSQRVQSQPCRIVLNTQTRSMLKKAATNSQHANLEEYASSCH